MLRNAGDLRDYNVHATDGVIGRVEQFYFDDESWVVRYLVVETGDWLGGPRVLISNYSIGAIDWQNRNINVTLTREQVKNAPGAELHRPVTRQYEAGFFDYYGYPYYWGEPGAYGLVTAPVVPVPLPAPDETVPQPPEDESSEDAHLQSTLDTIGYHIEAADGDIGHVEDFIVDDEDWSIRYVVVDTRNWWPGKQILLAPRWIEEVDWLDGKVRVPLAREVIRHAPEYDPSQPIMRSYEADLHDYYEQHLTRAGRATGWPLDPAIEAQRLQYAEDDPRRHTLKLRAMLNETAWHAREDVTKINEPRAQALFETTAEVLQGLIKAYEHYEDGNEPAWRR